ncbi:MAG: CotH kinase family protein [Bacteroidia bacterium]|nr:CotH kinase family protein [Bacteroidia bacterium]
MLRIFSLLSLFAGILPAGAQTTFYDLNNVQDIRIYFGFSNWDYRMDTAKAGAEGYIIADSVVVNGTRFDSCGVKYKGNSSYNSNNNKNPLHIELNSVLSQNYQGIQDIKLNNCYRDPSIVREVLSYDILKNYMHCPRANFAQVYINGGLRGVYVNAEAVNKDWVSDHFYVSGNTIVKCNPQQVSSTSGPNLKYLGSDSTLYYPYYELKSSYAWKDLTRLCDTLQNNAANMHKNLDVDRAIWMLAFSNLLVHLDSYSGAFAQNYYLVRDNNGRMNSVVWDLNMAFGVFSNTGSGSLSPTQMQTMNHLLHSTNSNRPLIQKILQNPKYKRMYIAHMRTLNNENFVNNSYYTTGQTLQGIIGPYYTNDPYKFYTYNDFINNLTTTITSFPSSIPGISWLMNARSSYISGLADFSAVPPSISNINYSPGAPASNDTVWITASLNNPTYAHLGYRYATPDKFTYVNMMDDGLHQDGAANDGIYGAFVMAQGGEIQYYIYAENNTAGLFSPERAEHNWHTILITVPAALPGQVTINEFMSQNVTYTTDPDGDYEDWVELYNNTPSNIGLDGLYMTDIFTTPAKWAFPVNAVIPAGGYLIIWCDEEGNEQGLHANFKLMSSGEQLMLSYASGTIIDSLSFGNLVADVSFHRCPNGNGPFSISTSPTIGTSNCSVGIAETGENTLIQVFPNPAQSHVTFIAGKEFQVLEILNVSGEQMNVIRSGKMNSASLDISGLPDGLYFIRTDTGISRRLMIVR